AGAVANGLEAPTVLQPAERTAEIVDDDLQFVAIERDQRGERLVDQLVGNSHLAHDRRPAARVLAALLDPHRAAERHELRILVHVGDEIEHVGGGVPHAALGGELRHASGHDHARARAALSRAKSAPAWWEERVSGEAATIEKRLA